MPKSASAIQFLAATGLGIIVGYTLLFIMYQNQCSNLLISQEKGHNETLSRLHLEHAKLVQECNSEQVNNSQRDLSQMQGLLDKQTSLASKYQHLLEKHEETLAKLSQALKDCDDSDKTIQSLKSEIARTQKELDNSSLAVEKVKMHSTKQIESLTQQLELQKSMVRQKVQEVQALRVDGTCAPAGNSEQIGRIQAAVRRRDLAQCLAALGDGPYVAEIALEAATATGETTATLQVVFRHVEEMPHTIWTFLSLVDLGLYSGTVIGLSGSGGALMGGAPSSATSKQIHSHLKRLYVEHGYGPEPFLLEETSPTAPCSQMTLGITEHGPQFFIPLQGVSPQEGFMSRSCPGEIIGGKEFLQKLVKEKTRATITSTRIVRQRAGTNEL